MLRQKEDFTGSKVLERERETEREREREKKKIPYNLIDKDCFQFLSP